MTLYEKAYSKAFEFGQTHIFEHYDELSDGEKERLCAQVLEANFKLVKKLYIGGTADEPSSAEAKDIKPANGIIKAKMAKSDRLSYIKEGLSAMRNGKVSAITLAGGQGTRLGHDGPKGTYDIGLPSHRTLFQLQCDSLKRISEDAGYAIPWYIMTGPDNHLMTEQYFMNNDYLGYGENNIKLFTQGALPLIDKEGKAVMKNKSELYCGPDGNGGVFAAAEGSGIVDDMKSKGIEWVFICGIDNAAIKMADPLLCGMALRHGCTLANKSVAKASADEKVGVFCYRDGRPSILEYFETPEELKRAALPDGSLLYNDANIVAHFMNISLLGSIASKGLPYHTAVKKVKCINAQTGEADEKTVYKYETFIFDAFSFSDDMLVLRVDREEFAPVKNRTGKDSPETALEILMHNGEK